MTVSLRIDLQCVGFADYDFAVFIARQHTDARY